AVAAAGDLHVAGEVGDLGGVRRAVDGARRMRVLKALVDGDAIAVDGGDGAPVVATVGAAVGVHARQGRRDGDGVPHLPTAGTLDLERGLTGRQAGRRTRPPRLGSALGVETPAAHHPEAHVVGDGGLGVPAGHAVVADELQPRAGAHAQVAADDDVGVRGNVALDLPRLPRRDLEAVREVPGDLDHPVNRRFELGRDRDDLIPDLEANGPHQWACSAGSYSGPQIR